MAPIEGAAALSPLTADDIDDGLALVREAGWNQVEADWRFMLASGVGTGIRDDAGRVIATSMVLPYRPGIGWIGMVLVAGAYRKRGFATMLLQQAMAICRDVRLTPMLDATAAGREVYQRLGFADGEMIERWRGMGGSTGTPDRHVDLARAKQLDHVAFAADRGALLDDLLKRDGAPCFALDNGVLLGRRGRTATQLGPLLSADQFTALALCERAIETIAGPLLIDVPVRENALRWMLKARGFAVERGFTRMSFGKPAPMGDAMRAIAGPELG